MTGGFGDNIDLRPGRAANSFVVDGSLWKELQRLHDRGHLMGCGSHSGSDAFVNAHGIVFGHAYSILDLIEGSDQHGTHQLMKLRNPHGRTEWKGK